MTSLLIILCSIYLPVSLAGLLELFDIFPHGLAAQVPHVSFTFLKAFQNTEIDHRSHRIMRSSVS